MPCTPRKARILLKEKKAKRIGYKPFIIQLCYPTGEATQPIGIGIDTGAKQIGIAITSQKNVLVKGKISLRQDIRENLIQRHTYRRSRRYRNTRYRKARFLNRKKPEGWLPPSLQARIEAHFFWIDKFCSFVPNPNLSIEVGKFDPAKRINPSIQGVDYQQGQTYGFYEERYFVFARDSYTCQVCKQKHKILRTHHLLYTSMGGTNRADNLVTVCTDCHTAENHQPGGILFQWMKAKKKTKQYKEPPFMNSLRKRIFAKYPHAEIVYGSATTPKRKELGLEKTHYNDAIAISGIEQIQQNKQEWFEIRQFRKKKRSLQEAIPRKGRKEPNRTAKRNAKNTPRSHGFSLNDSVVAFGKKGWITGFCNGGCYVKDIVGNYITKHGKNYKQISFKEIQPFSHNNNWQFAIHPTA